MKHQGLTIHDQTPETVEFTTALAEPYLATIADLDRARIRCVKSRTGKTTLGAHTITESDISALHNAIRDAGARCRCGLEPVVIDGLGQDCLRSLDQANEDAVAWDESA